MYRAADKSGKSRYPAPVRPGAGECPVLYSDRGARYRWPDLIDIVRAARRLPHDVEEGKDAGHARMEGFFGTLKQEFFHTGTGRA